MCGVGGVCRSGGAQSAGRAELVRLVGLVGSVWQVRLVGLVSLAQRSLTPHDLAQADAT